MPKCFHMASYRILKLCNEKPTPISEMYYQMHLKYPTLYKYVRVLVTAEWLEPVFSDGESAFQGKSAYQLVGKDNSRMRVGLVHFKLNDYYYSTTPHGKEILDAYRNLYDVAFRLLRGTTLAISLQRGLEIYEGEPLKKKRRK